MIFSKLSLRNKTEKLLKKFEIWVKKVNIALEFLLFCLKKDVVTISITGKAREYSRSQWRANSYEKDTDTF